MLKVQNFKVILKSLFFFCEYNIPGIIAFYAFLWHTPNLTLKDKVRKQVYKECFSNIQFENVGARIPRPSSRYYCSQVMFSRNNAAHFLEGYWMRDIFVVVGEVLGYWQAILATCTCTRGLACSLSSTQPAQVNVKLYLLSFTQHVYSVQQSTQFFYSSKSK